MPHVRSATQRLLACLRGCLAVRPACRGPGVAALLLGCCCAGAAARPAELPRQGPPGGFARVVVFGDSLSDNGAYTVAAVLRDGALAPYRLPYERGGQFSVNQAESPNWSDRLAGRLGLPLSPNLVGFRIGPWELFLTPERVMRSGNAATCAFDAPGADGLAHCTNHAQGGSRVQVPQGIGHDSGALTYPVSQQWQRHLRQFGEIRADDLVIVLAGNNDVFAAFARSQAAAGRVLLAGLPAAQARGLEQALPDVQAAADALGALVRDMLGHGARYLVVGTLPDSALTPYGQRVDGGASCDRTDPATRCHALSGLVDGFNARLRQELQQQPVLWLDLHGLFEHQTSRPQDFGLHNVRDPWCDPGLPSSLLCHASTPDSAVGADPANLDAWLFADTIHPTPAGHQALADRAVAELIAQGWVDAPAVR